LPRLKQQRIVHSARHVFSLEVAPSRSWLVRFYPLMPRRALEGLSGFARQGRCKDASRFSQGLGRPFEKPRSSLSSAGLTRHGEAFSLDTFFWPKIASTFSAFATSLWLATQKKVSRLPVRKSALNQ
jgi:hypothetical protein